MPRCVVPWRSAIDRKLVRVTKGAAEAETRLTACHVNCQVVLKLSIIAVYL